MGYWVEVYLRECLEHPSPRYMGCTHIDDTVRRFTVSINPEVDPGAWGEVFIHEVIHVMEMLRDERGARLRVASRLGEAVAEHLDGLLVKAMPAVMAVLKRLRRVGGVRLR